jgi:PBSX family phage terminase large subunit
MEDTVTIQIPVEYKQLFQPWWREAAVYGGRNSLKSHTVARYLLIRARQKKERIGCFREYQNSIADSSHALLKGLIEKYELTDFKVTDDSIKNLVTGSDFLFKGLHNNIQSVKSIEGMTIAWVEEAQTVTEASLDVLTPTVREKGSQLIYTYNRLRDKDPVHQRLVVEGRPNTLILNVNYDVAMKYGWMAEALVNEMEDDKARRPEVYKHKWLGAPSAMKGQIYPNWKKIDKIPKEAKFMGDGLDFGYTNDPTAVIDVYKWNNAYIVDEVVYERGLSNRRIANAVRVNRGLEPVSRDGTFVGATREITVGDSSEPKSIDDIKDYGVNIIGATKGKDSVNTGIQKLQELDIYYTATSYNIEEETLNYIWRVDKEDKSLNVPLDAYNHAMDAIRYKITDLEYTKAIEWGGVR